jgi:hypothetical protein
MILMTIISHNKYKRLSRSSNLRSRTIYYYRNKSFYVLHFLLGGNILAYIFWKIVYREILMKKANKSIIGLKFFLYIYYKSINFFYKIETS